MKITRAAKAVVYLVCALLLLVLSIWLQSRLHNLDTMQAAYFRANTCLLAGGVVLTGVAAYSWRAYTRRHSEHRVDSLFLLIAGLLILISGLFSALSFGGLSDIADNRWISAVNLNIVFLSLFPVPFFARSLVLSAKNENTSPIVRRGIPVLCAGVAVLCVVLCAVGIFARYIRV